MRIIGISGSPRVGGNTDSARRELRGRGIGKSLLNFVLSNLGKRGYSAIETFARRGSESNPTGPLEFYLKQGFSLKREWDQFPLVRKEFRTVIP